MNRDEAVRHLDRLHEAQNEFYAGGKGRGLGRLLAPDVTWAVPGDNRIAGTYRGIDQVLGYFELRRDLADRTFQMTRRDVLAGEGNRIAALTDGSATIRGARHSWSTIGLYEVNAGRIASCWLLALDQPSFDATWYAAPGSSPPS